MRGLSRGGCVSSLIRSVAVVLAVTQSVLFAQQENVSSPPPLDNSECVSINVKDANISEVLKAFSIQTGQSIVVGPDVISDKVNIRLNNIPWKEALEVILTPYGFGYREVGQTVVISTLENINKTLNSANEVERIEPLLSRVFHLNFLDAYDVQKICLAQLSARGRFTILETKTLPGWEFGGEGSKGAATEAGVRTRKKKEQIQKSKTIVVTDVPVALAKIQSILDEIDVLPHQVLIEAKFLEISTGDLSDIGLDYLNAIEHVEDLSSGGGTVTPVPIDDNLLKILNLTTGFPNPLETRAAGSISQDNGIRLSHSVVGDWGAEMLFAFMAKSDDSNVLSAPKILSVNNQEATILVGKKFPIIESQNNSGSGSTVTSTSLDYYENIGIQLNVVPQVCAHDYINMIVHPAVSEIEGFEAGVVTGGGGGVQSGTHYPILRVREAETQIIIKSSRTAIIGGLQSERDKEIIKKIPLLGDIPFLGRLFRRETLTKEKVDLLIFIKATIVENEHYSSTSKALEDQRNEKMGLDIFEQQAELDALSVTNKPARNIVEVSPLVENK